MTPSENITEATIAMLVDRFYAKVRRDPTIGPVFDSAIADWDGHLDKLCSFWSSVMLTTGRYKGTPMAAHMALPIEPVFFDRWLALWHETVTDVFVVAVAARLSAKAERIAESLKLGLSLKPGIGERRAAHQTPPKIGIAG
ncbi:MAG TPA: group III truncated hemoglobin [Telmatospirillum sp.]|nr:group III truncated hemoglobin [Telmatospirillum sp.]